MCSNFSALPCPFCGSAADWRSPRSAGACCATVSSQPTIPARWNAPVDAFYPLTIPLTVGPGSIAVAIALGAQRPEGADDLGRIVLLGAAAVVGLAAIAVTVFFCYRFADRMVAVLGRNGINVLIRLSAFILLCIGIQIMWSGYSALVGVAGN
jgi:small neutral amino acid transporter SnatA (MarC family)